MNYQYYPGCSLEGTAMEYNESTKALMKAIGVTLTELEDWSCCGASAAESVSHLLSLALPARNLAIAEKAKDGAADILVPCSACYLNLKKVSEKTRKDPELLKKLNNILQEEQLKLTGRVKVRHLLDVLATDIGADTLRPLVKKQLTGIKIAPYYGCQCLRPYAVFDDPETPKSMEPLIEAIGATVFHWEMGAKCCGASHMNTKPDVGIELVSSILSASVGADAIVTVCPMCQMNMEAYQDKASKKLGQEIKMTVIYLPQLIGLALGLSETDVRLDLNLSVRDQFRQKLNLNLSN